MREEVQLAFAQTRFLDLEIRSHVNFAGLSPGHSEMSHGEPNQNVNDSTLRITVVIPTYRRPDMLVRCVASLVAGSCLPDEIVIVGRKGDVGTENAIAAINGEHPSTVRIRSAWVTEPGYIPPVEAGVRIASGDLVAVAG